MNKRISRQTKKTKAPMFVLLAMIFIVIGIIATTFSFFVLDDLKRENTMQIPVNIASNSSSSKAEVSSETSSEVTSKPVVNTNFIQVPESEAVDKSYFDDAVFIGDSISKGFKLYGVLPPANVIADQGVHINNIADNKPVYMTTAGTKITMFEALKKLKFKPKKIYILLGMNSIPWLENKEHIDYYEKVLDQLIKAYPDAIIYVQSVTPITKNAERTSFTNKKINEFNNMALKLSENKNLYYLNVREVLVDKNGYLSSAFIAQKGGDGFHFLKIGHEALYQYYKTHTAPKKEVVIS